jgi:hypothetical protein
MRNPSERTDRRSPGDVVARGRVAGTSPFSYLRSLTRSAKGWGQWRSGHYELPPREPGYAARPFCRRPAPEPTEPKPPAGRRWRRLAVRGAVVMGLVAAVMAWCGRGGDRLSATVIVPAGVQQHSAGGSSSPDQLVNGPARPIYPMSVVPGGAYSVEELRAYLKTDPVARQSYEAQAKRVGDPDLLSHLVVKQVAKPTRMYSQLRKGDKLCWTSQPVTVEEGESGFYHNGTDKLIARARCGNVMVVTVPVCGPRIPPPQGGPIGWTVPTVTPTVVGVGGETGAQPVPPAQQQQQQAVPVPPRIPEVPRMALPPAPPIMPPPVAPPPIIVPPYIPPPQQQQQAVKGGGGFPWLALAGGFVAGRLLAGNRIEIHNTNRQHQSQQQNQKQKQKQEQEGPQPIPEPGTMLLMTLGLGAAGALARRRRKP